MKLNKVSLKDNISTSLARCPIPSVLILFLGIISYSLCQKVCRFPLALILKYI
jgi:hypothetical protein